MNRINDRQKGACFQAPLLFSIQHKILVLQKVLFPKHRLLLFKLVFSGAAQRTYPIIGKICEFHAFGLLVINITANRANISFHPAILLSSLRYTLIIPAFFIKESDFVTNFRKSHRGRRCRFGAKIRWFFTNNDESPISSALFPRRLNRVYADQSFRRL